MKVIIKETGKIEELRYNDVCSRDGRILLGECQMACDYVLSYEASLTTDSCGNFIMTQEQYDWWSDRLQQQLDLDWRIAELKIDHDASVVDEVVAEAIDGVEFIDMIYATNQALDDFEASKK